MKITIPYLFVYFFSISINCQAQDFIPKQELIEDLKYLNKALDKTHPIVINPIWNNRLDAFINHVDAVKADEVTVFEYDQSIREAISLIGCVHTAVIKSPLQDVLSEKINEMGNNMFFPLRICVDSSGLYVLDLEEDSQESSIQFPFKVDSINGIGWQELIYSMSVHYPQDSYQKTLAYKLLNTHGYYFLRRHFYAVNSILIKGKSENGEKLELNVEAVQRYKNNQFEYYQPDGEQLIKEQNVSFFDLNSESAYVKMKTVSYENYQEVHKTIFDYLNSTKKDNLIIDLRGNGGGSQMVYLDFLSNLSSETLCIEMIKRDESGLDFFSKKRHKAKPLKKYYKRSEKIEKGTKYFINPIPSKTTLFKGNLYVLINGETASGASQLASFLKNSLNAICIGQETAGGETGNNGHGYDQLELPNSKITINWPQYNVKLILPIPINHRGVIPNVEIKYEPKHYMLNRDLEMEKVFQLIIRKDYTRN